MNAPDKIYIQQDMINNIPLEEKEYDDDVCYIRKDALLEWAKEKHVDLTKKLEAQDDPVLWGQRNAFQQVIDKINSL